jgi:pSer/pThr/pTyr-binding forkhead associated (FHA) protein
LQLPGDLLHRSVSRHHCLLDIDPPRVMVRDLGSRNGTFLNGKKIGQRNQGLVPEEAVATDLPECSVHPGDSIQLGETVLEVTLCPNDSLDSLDVLFGRDDQTPNPGQRLVPVKDWNI